MYTSPYSNILFTESSGYCKPEQNTELTHKSREEARNWLIEKIYTDIERINDKDVSNIFSYYKNRLLSNKVKHLCKDTINALNQSAGPYFSLKAFALNSANAATGNSFAKIQLVDNLLMHMYSNWDTFNNSLHTLLPEELKDIDKNLKIVETIGHKAIDDIFLNGLYREDRNWKHVLNFAAFFATVIAAILVFIGSRHGLDSEQATYNRVSSGLSSTIREHSSFIANNSWSALDKAYETLNLSRNQSTDLKTSYAAKVTTNTLVGAGAMLAMSFSVISAYLYFRALRCTNHIKAHQIQTQYMKLDFSKLQNAIGSAIDKLEARDTKSRITQAIGNTAKTMLDNRDNVSAATYDDTGTGMADYYQSTSYTAPTVATLSAVSLEQPLSPLSDPVQGADHSLKTTLDQSVQTVQPDSLSRSIDTDACLPLAEKTAHTRTTLAQLIQTDRSDSSSPPMNASIQSPYSQRKTKHASNTSTDNPADGNTAPPDSEYINVARKGKLKSSSRTRPLPVQGDRVSPHDIPQSQRSNEYSPDSSPLRKRISKTTDTRKVQIWKP